MKNKLFFIIPIVLAAFLIALILIPKKEDPQKAGANFLKEYYSFSQGDIVDRENISDNLKLAEILKEKYQTIAWNDCIELLVQNRYYDQIQELYIKEESNDLIFQQAELDLLDKGSAEDNIKAYSYECIFKVKDNKYVANGQITIEKSDGIWKAKKFVPASTKKQES